MTARESRPRGAAPETSATTTTDTVPDGGAAAVVAGGLGAGDEGRSTVRAELPPAELIACDYCSPGDRGPIPYAEHGARLRRGAAERNARRAELEVRPDPPQPPRLGRRLRVLPGGAS